MKNYCPDLFSGMFIEKIDENKIYLAHCCVSKKSAATDTIDMNHQDLQKSRQYFLDTGELPDDCSYCKNAEKDSRSSRRLGRYNLFAKDNKFPIKIQLTKLDYNCDNICNLKCIICTGGYSSAWLEDEVKLGLRQTSNIKKTKSNDVFKNLDVSNLETVYFNGGEPLMTKDHINVINYIIEHGNPANVEILYSSNGTFFPSPAIIELWSKFRKVKINFSIDAVGSAFSYVRYPANWESVEQNLLNYKKLELSNFESSILASVGVHNILYYDELYKWCVDNNYDISVQNVVGRTGLSVLNFPLEHKEYLLNYLNALPESNSKNYLLSVANSITSPSLTWIDYLNKLDAIRNVNWHIELNKLYSLNPATFQDDPKRITWHEFLNNITLSTLIYNCKTTNNELKQIKIEVARTKFAEQWKQYLLKTSKDMPTIDWKITIGGCKIKDKEETPRIEWLTGLLDIFTFLSSAINDDFQQEISDLKHILENPTDLTQQHLNAWHRQYTIQISRFYQGEFGSSEIIHNNIQRLNQTVHDLEISTYYRLKHRDLIEHKTFHYINCTDGREFATKYKLFEKNNNDTTLTNDSFDPLKEDYNYNVWLGEDIQGKDHIKAWLEEDDLTASDCTGNLFMTPNIMIDPDNIFKSVIDHPDWQNQYIKSGKTLNRWPVGNIVNLDEINWDDLANATVESIELDGVSLWQKPI